MVFSDRFKKSFKAKYGTWALVTGASSGIGKALCEQLAANGMHIILSGRYTETLLPLSDHLEAQYNIVTEVVTADVSSTPEVYRLVEEIRHIPIGLFVASAGFGTSGHFKDADLDQEIQMLKVNSLALMMLTHFFARKFAEQQRGGIILMSSIVGFQGTPNAAHYAATKAYVQSLGEALYHELKPYGVNVLAAAPGPVHSKFAQVANMEMVKALTPEEVTKGIIKALGKRPTVFPGTLTKILIFGLRTVPRWGKIRIMKMVMGGMTKHQNEYV
ncbi:MAG: SDR family oxidoreductase [Bacteroidota bacterium]